MKVTVLVRQQSRFIGIMDNFNRVQETHNELMDAGGTLNESYVTYMDSVEASANRAQASLEGMWINAINSDVIKNYYEMVVVIIEAIEKFGALRLAVTGLSYVLIRSNQTYKDWSKTLSTDTVAKMNKSIEAMVRNLEAQSIQARMSGRSMSVLGMNMTGAGVSSNILGTALKVLNFEVFGLKIGVMALQATLTFGLSLAISLIVEGLAKWAGASRKAKQEVEELGSSVKSNISTYRSNIKTLSEMRVEYDRLNEKLGENRDFTKLSAEEQERYNSLVESMAQIAPEIVKGYNEKGEAVVAYTTNIQDLIDREKELIELENYRLMSEGKKIVKSSESNISKERKAIDSLDQEISDKELRIMQLEATIDNTRDSAREDTQNKRRDLILKTRQEIAQLDAQRRISLNLIDSEVDKQRELISAHQMEMESMEEVSKSLKTLAKDRIDAILVEDGWEGATIEVEKYTEAFKVLTELLSNADLEDSAENISQASEQIENLGFSSEDTEELIYRFTDTLHLTEEAFEALSMVMGIASSEFEKMVEKVDKLDSAFAKLVSGKGLGRDELLGLIENYDELAEYIAETGDLTFKNGELISELSERHQAELIAEIELKKQSSQIAYDEAINRRKIEEESLKALGVRLGEEHKLYKEKQKSLEKIIELEKTSYTELNRATSQAIAFQHVYQNSFSEAGIEAHTGAFKEATSNLSAYKDILEEINETGKLSGETNRKIIESHQELMPYLGREAEMREIIIGLIEESTSKQLESYKQSLLASEDFSRKVFDANKELFNKIFALYDLDLKNFRDIQSAKAQMLKQSMNAMTSAQRQYVDNANAMGVADSTAVLRVLNTELREAQGNTLQLQKDSTSVTGLPSILDMAKQSNHRDIATIKADIARAEGMAQFDQITGSAIKDIDLNLDFSSSKGGTKKAGGSKSSKDKSYKDVERIELLIERYLKFDKAMEDVNRRLEQNNQLLDYATGEDRVKLLAKEVDLLKEKQKVLHLTTQENRKEFAELQKILKTNIDLNDGTLGADSFNAYTKNIENVLNNIVSQINNSTDDTVRDTLTTKQNEIKKAYDSFKVDFDRYMDLQGQIADNGVDWWGIEAEKFNKLLEVIDVNLKKYSDRINHINTTLTTMIVVREDNAEELEKEYELLGKISEIYKESLEDNRQKIEDNDSLISHYEKQLKALGDIRGAEYDAIAKRMMFARAEQDKWYEVEKNLIESLAGHEKARIDKYLAQLNRAKEETIKALEEIRQEADRFSLSSFEVSIESILEDLNKIDKIFMQGAEFNLSTDEARQDLDYWKSEITNTLSDIYGLESEVQAIMSSQTTTEAEKLEKKNKLVKLIEQQIGKENELKDLEREIRNEVERTALEHKKIENALDEKLRLKQDELKNLQEQFQQEDKIKRMLEKQLDLMRAMDDTRYSYITGQGEETFSYDQGRVNEIQKEIADMTRQDQREEQLKALRLEIEKMQENIATTKEINKQQLDILKLGRDAVSSLIGELGQGIGTSMEDLGKIYKDMGDDFINDVKTEFAETNSWLERIWESIQNRVTLDSSVDKASINKQKIGDKTPATPSTPQVPTATATPTQQDKIHTVVSGDSMAKIAKKFNTTVDKLMSANPHIVNKNLIYPNQKIKIPSFETGGMTPDVGSDGALAILHGKELVLNKQDTENVLESVDLASNFAKSLTRMDTSFGKNVSNSSEESKSIVLNNPVFQGVENVGKFASELNNLYRRGMPSIG